MLRYGFIFGLCLTLAAEPALALAPSSFGAAPGPVLTLDLQQFSFVTAGGEIWELREQRTDDTWYLKFPRPVPFSAVTESTIAIPSPVEVGLKLPAPFQTEKIWWIDTPAENKTFLELEWKIRIWKKAALSHYKGFDLSQEFDRVRNHETDPFNSRRFLGEKKMFQERDGIFLEGDGIWGLPRKWVGRERRDVLLVYRHRPTTDEMANGRIPLPDELGAFEPPSGPKSRFVIHPLTSIGDLENIIAQDKLKLSSEPVSRKRRRRAFHLNGLISVERQWRIKIRELDSLKAKALRMKNEPLLFFGRDSGEGSERRSWQDRRKGERRQEERTPPTMREERRKQKRVRQPWLVRRNADRTLRQFEEKIHHLQNDLQYEFPQKLQRETLQLELREIENHFLRKRALIVRNLYGDEIGYQIFGNEKSRRPPIVVFAGWEGMKEEPLFNLLETNPEVRKLLREFRFFVVTPLGYPHRVRDSKCPLQVSRDGTSENYVQRAAQAFGAILLAEGEKSAYVLGSGFGGLVAQEAARSYRKGMISPEGEILPDSVVGVILLNPAMVNPIHGSDYDLAEVFPRLTALPTVGEWIRERGNALWNETTPGRLPRNLRGVRWVAAQAIRLAYRHLLGGVGREETEAQATSIGALLSLTRDDVRERFAALRELPVLCCLPSSPESRQFVREVPNARMVTLPSGARILNLAPLLHFLTGKKGAAGIPLQPPSSAETSL